MINIHNFFFRISLSVVLSSMVNLPVAECPFANKSVLNNATTIEYGNTRFLHDESEFKNTPAEIMERRLKKYRISKLS